MDETRSLGMFHFNIQNFKSLTGALDIGDELDVDLYQLVDTVLDEIEEAKQKQLSGDSDDQIMPTASPSIYDTDLMDELDTPFHHDGGNTSFGSHKSVNLSYQEQAFSPDRLEESWSFDYIEELSRKEHFFNNTYSQTVDKYGTSYSESIKARVGVDYSQTVERCQTAPSNLSHLSQSERVTGDQQIKMEAFEQQHSKISASRGFSDDISPNKDYHSLKRCQEFPQVMYNDSLQPIQQNSDIPSHQLHYQPVDQAQSARQHPALQQSAMFPDDDSNDAVDMSSPSFLSWTCKHPENWSEAEVLDWLYYSAERNGIDCSLLPGEAFHSVKGRDLCRMSADDFQSLEPRFGQYFYSLFRQLLNGLRFSQPTEILDAELPSDRDIHRLIDNNFSPRAVAPSQQQGEIYAPAHMSSPPSPDAYYTYQQTRSFNNEYASSSGLVEKSIADDPDFIQVYDYSTEPQGLKYEPDYRYDYPSQSRHPVEGSSYRPYKTDKASVISKYAGVVTPRRRPGRPRIKNLPTAEELRIRQEKKLKSQHLWEFIFDMLNNPEYNPQVLKWENQREGVFRFIQSETIAQRWGDLKNNDNMTYEKLSRAMRHYYKRGILERVEGRRLVYKFSLSTLQRMQEKRQNSQHKVSSDIANVSNSTPIRQEEKRLPDVQTASQPTTSNIAYPQLEDKQIVYYRSMPSDINDSFQLATDGHAHAHNLSLRDIGQGSTTNFSRYDEQRMSAFHEHSSHYYTSNSDTRSNKEHKTNLNSAIETM